MNLTETYRSMRAKTIAKPPAGMLTVSQWATKENKGVAQTAKMLRELKAAGIFKGEKYPVIAVTGGISMAMHYGPAPKK